MGELIEVKKRGKIAELALNRPEAFNALSLEMLTRLAEILTDLAMDPGVRGVVILGRGKAFCAGGDLRWANSHPGGPGAAFHALAGQFHKAVLEIRGMPKPVVAAVNGVAAGGGFSLALACDIRIIEKSALMKLGYPSAGLAIDGGGTFTLPRLVGFARALEIAALDEPISADQALEWGLVTKVVENGQSLGEAINLLNQLAKKSLHSFAASKKLFNQSFCRSLETQMESEREALRACGEHREGREGVRAFIEKRKPVFDAGEG